MRGAWQIGNVGNALLLTSAFIVSVLSVSNLLPLLLYMTFRGMTIWNGLLSAGDLCASVLSVTVLARAMYRLDKKAGRIRNRIRWFE